MNYLLEKFSIKINNMFMWDEILYIAIFEFLA